MFAIFLTPDYAVFSIAFVVMLGIGLIEAVGLGLGQFNIDGGADGVAPGVLDWLGLTSGLPVLVWFTSLLGCFTIAGLAVQQLATAIIGGPLHWGIAATVALVTGGFVNGFASAGLARIMPEYESSIIDTDDLIMRRCTVLEGAARRGHPARAKVVDQHGQAHYIMVEPHHDADVIGQGETALLVRRVGPLFFMQPEAATQFRPI